MAINIDAPESSSKLQILEEEKNQRGLKEIKVEDMLVEMIEEMRGLRTSLSICEHYCISSNPLLNHFSHPHPLHLAFAQARISAPCHGCKLPPSSAWIYKCDECAYVLHASCSQMPQRINHPIDLKHPLFLLPRPAYSSALFGCNACGRSGDVFCYHCALCQIDIHIQCVSVPHSLASSTHAHPLALAFAPIPNSSGCDCDVCGRGVGSRYWRYRCNECNFDAHLYCAREEGVAATRAAVAAGGDTDGAEDE